MIFQIKRSQNTWSCLIVFGSFVIFLSRVKPKTKENSLGQASQHQKNYHQSEEEYADVLKMMKELSNIWRVSMTGTV